MKKIQILGTGCPKCKKLLENVEEVSREVNSDFVIEKVDDINEILQYGVMTTPALAVDGEVKAAGRILSRDEILKILKGINQEQDI